MNCSPTVLSVLSKNMKFEEFMYVCWKSEVAKKGEATCGEEMSAKTGEVLLKISKHTNKSKHTKSNTQINQNTPTHKSS